MNDDNTVHVSAEEAHDMEGRTDWERLREMSDKDIARVANEDPDAAPLLDETWFESAAVLDPSGEKEQISIRLDRDVLRYFRAQGRGYQSRINKVLRAFVTAKRVPKKQKSKRRVAAKRSVPLLKRNQLPENQDTPNEDA